MQEAHKFRRVPILNQELAGPETTKMRGTGSLSLRTTRGQRVSSRAPACPCARAHTVFRVCFGHCALKRVHFKEASTGGVGSEENLGG